MVYTMSNIRRNTRCSGGEALLENCDRFGESLNKFWEEEPLENCDRFAFFCRNRRCFLYDDTKISIAN
jgi:hypothetical protein